MARAPAARSSEGSGISMRALSNGHQLVPESAGDHDSWEDGSADLHPNRAHLCLLLERHKGEVER